jgi:hypothetical protein
MTVAHGGRPNALGAALFVGSLCILVVGLGATLVGFIRMYSTSPTSRRLARAAAAVGLLVCAAFVGVAVTPENRVLALHIQLTLFAFRVFPVTSALLTFAALRTNGTPRRVAMAWALLTAVLAAFVGVLAWGPSIRAPNGLVVQVLAQKTVAISAVAIMVYQSYQADRILKATTIRK